MCSGGDPDQPFGRSIAAGPGASSKIQRAVEILNASRKPALLLGMQASDPRTARSVLEFVASSGIPYISTFQGPGTWVGESCESLFAGRFGLFKNQPGDALLAESDCVVTIGYEHLEFDPSIWNAGLNHPIVAIDAIPARQDRDFLPSAEIVGDIGASLDLLRGLLKPSIDPAYLTLAGQDRAGSTSPTLRRSPRRSRMDLPPRCRSLFPSRWTIRTTSNSWSRSTGAP